MTDADRRRFIQLSAATLGASVLPGCGGSGEEGLEGRVSGSGSSLTGVLPSPVPPPSPAPAGAMQFILRTDATNTSAPFALGYAFRAGDIPAGSTVVSDYGSLQVTPRNTWPDGSLKFAQLAGRVNLPANTDVAITLRKQRSGSGTTTFGRADLTLADLKKTGITAQTGCGSFGTASWAGADWDTPFQTWVSGPIMSSWIYRKPVGTDAHLVAWLEVRLFAGGAVEVLPWIENGYVNKAGPTSKSATYTFKLGGSPRFSTLIDLAHHQRTPLINGTALSHWLGSDPAVTPRHDTDYLQATEIVPNYSAVVPATASIVSQLVSSFLPLQQGNFNYDGDYMGATGYQEPIGLLPQHDVLYLTTNASNTYAAVVRNGYSAGRYPIHYRDETTNRPLRFSSYPSLVIADGGGFKDNGGGNSHTPPVSGTLPPTWDVAHSPSVGFMAYLVTGRWYFMEQTQFAATTNFLGKDAGPQQRNGAQGLVQTAVQAWQTRSCAWDWRTLTQALCVTPDGDTTLRNEFIASVEANINFFYTTYAKGPNVSPWGWILPGEAAYDNTTRLGAPWQQDFVTAAFGYSLSMGLPVSIAASTNLASFFQWKAQSIVKRLGQDNAYWYINAAPYNMVVSPSSAPDYTGGTGPWYTPAEAYAATRAVAGNSTWWGSSEGVLAGEIMPGERAMWGNAMPALAYAVRHGVPGALVSYNRMTSASNWPALRDAFNANPVWSVTSQRAQPAWLQGKALNEWFAISGTAGAGGAPLNDYSGFGLTPSGKLAAGAGGGHGGSLDNRVVSLDLLSDVPSWSVLNAASSNAPYDVAYNPDGKPASRHTYHSTIYVPFFDRMMLFGVRYTFPGGYTFNKVDGFNVTTDVWDGVVPGKPGQGGSGYADIVPGHYGAAIDGAGNVWSTFGLAKYTPGANSWSLPVNAPAPNNVRYPWAWDSRRQQMFGLCWGEGEGDVGYTDVRAVKQVGALQTQVTLNNSAALSQFIADKPSYAGMDYDADNDRFLFISGDHPTRIYVITPNDGSVWDISLFTLGVGSATLPASGKPIVSKFKYVAQLKGFVCMPDATQDIYFIRTA